MINIGLKSLQYICCQSLYHSLSFIVTCCTTLCHSLSFVLPLVVTRCYSLSLAVPLVVIRCYPLYHSLSLVVICCHSFYHSLWLVVIRCTTRCHSLSFVVTCCTTRLSFYKRSEKQGFERFLIFLDIKMSTKPNEINSVKSLWLCGEKNRPSEMYCSLCVETKMKKTKVWKECKINFRFFQTDIFRIKFCFECEIFFQLAPEILKFQLCF